VTSHELIFTKISLQLANLIDNRSFPTRYSHSYNRFIFCNKTTRSHCTSNTSTDNKICTMQCMVPCSYRPHFMLLRHPCKLDPLIYEYPYNLTKICASSESVHSTNTTNYKETAQ